jgi:hypothetical protein
MRKIIRLLFLVSAVCLLSVTVRAKDKNPYKGSGKRPARTAGSKQGALFTTEKKRPNKAERNSVFEDLRIPKEQRRNYVAEYRVPVSLGGSNAYSNIEVIPKSQARMKHRVQNQLEAKLRSKELSQDEAQLRILNWQADPLSTLVP